MNFPASRPAAPVGYVIECRGTWLRAQIGGIATVVEMNGHLDGANSTAVAHHLCRFARLGYPLIVDFGQADAIDGAELSELVLAVGDRCRQRGVDFVLVGVGTDGQPTHLHPAGWPPSAASVAEALHRILGSTRTLPQLRLMAPHRSRC